VKGEFASSKRGIDEARVVFDGLPVRSMNVPEAMKPWLNELDTFSEKRTSKVLFAMRSIKDAKGRCVCDEHIDLARNGSPFLCQICLRCVKGPSLKVWNPR
jgi:hypothetical protein